MFNRSYVQVETDFKKVSTDIKLEPRGTVNICKNLMKIKLLICLSGNSVGKRDILEYGVRSFLLVG